MYVANVTNIEIGEFSGWFNGVISNIEIIAADKIDCFITQYKLSQKDKASILNLQLEEFIQFELEVLESDLLLINIIRIDYNENSDHIS